MKYTKCQVVTGEKLVDPEVVEYFKEFTKRRYTQSDLCRATGFSSGTISQCVSNGICSATLKEALGKLAKNAEGNYSNAGVQNHMASRRILEEQAVKRIECYKQKIQKAIVDHENSLKNLMEANKRNYVKLSIAVKKTERKLLETIKNELKPYSLIYSKQTEDLTAGMWDDLDELMVDMSQSSSIRHV